MSEQRYSFDTPAPIDLYVENGSGSVQVDATDTPTTDIVITGKRSDEVMVEQAGNRISVVVPKSRGGFGRDTDIHVRVTCPTASEAKIQTGSADIRLDGELSRVDSKTGSGDVVVGTVTGAVNTQTGSGDVRVEQAGGDLRVKCGSGDVEIGRNAARAVVSTGSGDVTLHDSDTAEVKTGSGDLYVAKAAGDVSLSTGSGDLQVDRVTKGSVTLRGASSDARVGIPAGTPVWTEISTLSGSIRSTLEPTGAPAEGQDHVEVRIKTVSGDIDLAQL